MTPAEPARPVLARLADGVIPGIPRVRAQVAPYAAQWRAANAAALREPGPTWVVLGDSMSQGIGAPQARLGWVGQLHARLGAAGYRLRLVNLSATGARVQDVVDTQLPRLRALGPVALTTILIGANDMFPPRRRRAAVPAFARLLAERPDGQTVIASLPRRNREARAINAMIDEAAAAGQVRLADLRRLNLRVALTTLADDFYHPNQRGHAWLADLFAAAIDLDRLAAG